MNPPEHIGVVAHARRAQSIPVAERIVQTLNQRGIKTWMTIRWDNAQHQEMEQSTDLVIAIGGDGAMLRAARTCAPYQIPVLGVNMGYVGFLPEISSPNQWERHLDQLLRGAFWVERRMTLDVTITRNHVAIAAGSALNDIVINRNRTVGTVLLQTYIDGYWATTYHADALIVATPTGSTAYALAAGGPILPPELHNILIIPVAPHLSMDRPIILSEGSTVQVVLSSERGHDAGVVTDGSALTDIQPGDRVSIRAGKDYGLFVRMRDRNYFYRSLLDRLEPRVPNRATPDKLQLPPENDSNEL
ncbi:MAG: NAD(+)/NADH kinase [Chloroflexota bacterium]